MSSSTARPQRPGRDRSDPDSRSHHRIRDVKALATRDAEHRALPAGAESEGEELLRVGPTSTVATQFLWCREVDLHDAVGRGAVTATTTGDGCLGGVQNAWTLVDIAHDFSETDGHLLQPSYERWSERRSQLVTAIFVRT